MIPSDLDVAYEHELLRGDPAKEIVRFAKNEGVDFIVMANRADVTETES